MIKKMSSFIKCVWYILTKRSECWWLDLCSLHVSVGIITLTDHQVAPSKALTATSVCVNVD